MARFCKTCGVEINPKRIEILPNTQTCTQHSTVEKKAAITVQMGEGDHTWTETFVVDREVSRKIEEEENKFRKQVIEASKPDFISEEDIDDKDEDEEDDEDNPIIED
jgi:hypothetical protein